MRLARCRRLGGRGLSHNTHDAPQPVLAEAGGTRKAEARAMRQSRRTAPNKANFGVFGLEMRVPRENKANWAARRAATPNLRSQIAEGMHEGRWERPVSLNMRNEPNSRRPRITIRSILEMVYRRLRWSGGSGDEPNWAGTVGRAEGPDVSFLGTLRGRGLKRGFPLPEIRG